jgi:hypothetical protein
MKKSGLRCFFTFLMMMLAGIILPTTAWTLDFSGYARQYSAAFVSQDTTPLFIKDTFVLRAEQRGDSVKLMTEVYLHHFPGKVIEMGMRQAWIDILAGDLFLRIGKQQIVWGKADGVFITDVISPKDLREFLLQDFEEIRMGITALRARYSLGTSFFELVFVPGFVPTQTPESDSHWYPKTTSSIPLSLDTSSKDLPLNLANSEAFIRFGMNASGIDFELMAGYMHDDDPARHISIQSDPITHAVTGMTISPQHHPLGIAGGSVSIPLGAIVFKSDIAAYFGKYFSANPFFSDGLVMRDYLHAMLGMDLTLEGWTFGLQGIVKFIPDHSETMEAVRYEKTITFRAVRTWLRETLRLELFTYIGLEEPDALIRAKLAWDMVDGLRLSLGVNIFAGTAGNFGQYGANDMLYSEVRFSY